MRHFPAEFHGLRPGRASTAAGLHRSWIQPVRSWIIPGTNGLITFLNEVLNGELLLAPPLIFPFSLKHFAENAKNFLWTSLQL